MLSFSEINEKNEVVKIWAPKRTGNYASDCALGREHASEAIRQMRASGNPALLSHIVRCFDQIEGVEVGFLYQIALEVITPS